MRRKSHVRFLGEGAAVTFLLTRLMASGMMGTVRLTDEEGRPMLIKGRVVKVVEKSEETDSKDSEHGHRNLQGPLCHHGGGAANKTACRSSRM